MTKTSKSETQARLRKEKEERVAQMAQQKAARLDKEAQHTAERRAALEQHAKLIAALYKSMREYEAHAEKKAGFELKKAAEKRTALEQTLLVAKELCKAAGEDFKAFQEKFAPNYKRTQLYQVLAIADGRKTVEDVRKGNRERKRKQRAGESVRDKNDVTDKASKAERRRLAMEAKAEQLVSNKPAFSTTLELPPNGGGSQPIFMASAEKPIEQVQAEFDKLAAAEATAVHEAEIGEANLEAEPDTGQSVAPTETPVAEPSAVVNKPDDDRPLAEKLHYALNDVWSLCQDQNNWSHLSADQKLELRGAMTKLGYLRELLPRLATPKSTLH